MLFQIYTDKMKKDRTKLQEEDGADRYKIVCAAELIGRPGSVRVFL